MDINDPSQITKKIYISQGTPTEYKYIQVFIAPNYITLNRRWQMRPRAKHSDNGPRVINGPKMELKYAKVWVNLNRAHRPNTRS